MPLKDNLFLSPQGRRQPPVGVVQAIERQAVDGPARAGTNAFDRRASVSSTARIVRSNPMAASQGKNAQPYHYCFEHGYYLSEPTLADCRRRLLAYLASRSGLEPGGASPRSP